MNSNIFFMILLLIGSISSTNLKTKCRAVADDCDLFHFCCGDYVCRDYRCTTKDYEEDTEKFFPDGAKCDWMHSCSPNYHCESHRCILDKDQLLYAVKAQETALKEKNEQKQKQGQKLKQQQKQKAKQQQKK